MAATDGALQIVPLDELTELRNLYLLDWPKYAFTFYTLDNFVRWRKCARRDKDQAVYTDPKQNWRGSGAFVAKDHNELFFDTLRDPDTSLKELLATVMSCCGPTVSVVYNPRFRELLVSTANTFSYGQTSDERMVCYRQSVPRGTAEQSELPFGYRFGPVLPNDSPVVEREWKHNAPMFANLPTRLIERNPSLGIYDSERQLVAWCLIDQTGSLALFQTVATHQRKGLGRAIIERFSNELHGAGQLPQAFVVEGNVASRSLFEKLGFDVVDLWHWTKFDKLGKV